MDVKALYPSVPRDEARKAAEAALNEREDTDTDIQVILRLMDFVLENNLFSFNGKKYIQTQGTAIGSKLGRNYACTYLGTWEQELMRRT